MMSNSLTTIKEKKMVAHMSPLHPGEMLVEEFIKPLGLTQTHLAEETGIPLARINQICLHKRGITADTDLRLSRYFGLSEGWWLRVQAHYDIQTTKDSLGSRLVRECRVLPKRDGALLAVV